MDLFLIRDAANGRKQWARTVRGLARLKIRFDRVLHSPLLRAVETAEALMPLCAGESVVSSKLAEPPGAELLAEISGDKVALVGHEPWLSQLLALLILGSTEEGLRFTLDEGSVCRLQGEPRPRGMRMSMGLTT